jgi:tetratricopeptide (TPR) repeat protein
LNLFDSWATAKRPRPHLPAGLVRLAEEARRADPSNAWILLANLYASIAAGDTGQAERWVRHIDERRTTTPALRIIFACARLACGLGDTDDALRVWRKAVRETPSPMASAFVSPAIHALRKRRWKEALALLDQAENCDLPLFPALHTAPVPSFVGGAAASRNARKIQTTA